MQNTQQIFIVGPNCSALKFKARSAFQTRFATNMAMNLETSSKDIATEVDHVDMLDASFDSFEGVIINIKEDMDENVFIILLRASISQWRQQVIHIINYVFQVIS